MPVPKKRTSHAKQGKRRSHLRVHNPQLVTCDKCQAPKLRHRICPTCGTYKAVAYGESKVS